MPVYSPCLANIPETNTLVGAHNDREVQLSASGEVGLQMYEGSFSRSSTSAVRKSGYGSDLHVKPSSKLFVKGVLVFGFKSAVLDLSMLLHVSPRGRQTRAGWETELRCNLRPLCTRPTRIGSR